MDRQVSDIIVTVGGKKKFFDFRNGLVLARDDDYAMLHGAGGEKHAPNSTIKLTLTDYSNQPSVFVGANLAPAVVDQMFTVCRKNVGTDYNGTAELAAAATTINGRLERIFAGLVTAFARTTIACGHIVTGKGHERGPAADFGQMARAAKECLVSDMEQPAFSARGSYTEYAFHQDKVNTYRRHPKNNRLVFVSVVDVTRKQYNDAGELRRYPWTLSVKNFFAPEIKQENGTTAYSAKDAIRSMQSIIDSAGMWRGPLGQGDGANTGYDLDAEITEAQEAIVNKALEALDDPTCLGTNGKFSGCAQFVNLVYKAAGYPFEGRDAINYWSEWQTTGGTSRDYIPVGAVVVSAAGGEDGSKFGHVGIYIGKWDKNSIQKETWTGVDGNTYSRLAGRQAETFEERYEATLKELADLGIVISSGSRHGGGQDIVAVALREASAPDSMEQPLGSNNVKYNWWRYNIKPIHDPTGDTYAWCANFVAWCANECGYIESGLFNMSENVMGVIDYQRNRNGFNVVPARSLKQFGGIQEVAAGDIFCFGPYAHIGIVTAVTDTTFDVTQGNTSDRVKTLTYNKASMRDPNVSNGVLIQMVYPGYASGVQQEIAPGQKTPRTPYLTGTDQLNINPGTIATHGTMETLRYTTSRGTAGEARVYLPHGYDQNDRKKAYNVMFLIPGTGGTKYSWLEDSWVGEGMCGKTVLDYVFANDYADPFIAVSVDLFNLGNGGAAGAAGDILSILSALDSQYNTYNSTRVDSSLRASGIRSHYGVIGVSEGGAQMYKIIVQYRMDRFGYIGFVSPGEGPECLFGYKHQNDRESLKKETQKILDQYPVYGGFSSSGTGSMYNEQYYQGKADQTKIFFKELNAPFTQWTFIGAGHAFKGNFFNALYNASLMFFPESGDAM